MTETDAPIADSSPEQFEAKYCIEHRANIDHARQNANHLMALAYAIKQMHMAGMVQQVETTRKLMNGER